MKRFILFLSVLFLMVALSSLLGSCALEQNQPPQDLTGMVTIEVDAEELKFNTELAEKQLGRKFEFYTWQKLSSNTYSLSFYDKDANIIGYANVKLNN